jgi:hypothetical protein
MKRFRFAFCVLAMTTLVCGCDPRRQESKVVYALAKDRQFVGQLEEQVDRMARSGALDVRLGDVSRGYAPGDYAVPLKSGLVADRIGEGVRATVFFGEDGRPSAVFFSRMPFCGFVVKLHPAGEDHVLHIKPVTARTSTVCLPRD